MKKKNQAQQRNSSAIIGLFIILFGILLLINNLVPGFYFLNRLFSWPVILIVIGVVIGHKSRYENPISYILIGIGVFFLVLRLFSVYLNAAIFWPVILIAIGFTLIINQTKRSRKNRFLQDSLSNNPSWDKRVIDDESTSIKNHDVNEDGVTNEEEKESNQNSETEDPESNFTKKDTKSQSNFNSNLRDDYVDSSSIFGSNKINVVSRNFKGGNILNIFAGTEINFMHADINDSVSLEVIQLFGGCTIIAPAHWIIQSEMGSFFGGIEDKRFTNSMPDHQKVLYIRGTSLFGGITIKSI